jgi:hypothetical protein
MKKETLFWSSLILIFGIFILGVLGLIIHLIIVQFTFPSGEPCETWVNQETLLIEHNCLEKYTCIKSRWGSSRSLAMGHSKDNPAIGECVRDWTQ